MHRFARSAARALSTVSRQPQKTAQTAARSLSSPTSPVTVPNTTNVKPTRTATMAANTFLDFIKDRRTIYTLNKELTITPARIQEIVTEALQHVPSSFNSQSNRVVVLFGAEHDRFWDITTDVLKAIVPEDKFEPTRQKMAMFKGAAGSILFFEDQTIVEGMQAKFAAYSDRFPVWATQSDGMLQHTLWVALEAEGLGANLQHYNPIVDLKVQEAWKVPATWKLNAQLVFGGRAGEAGEKTFVPVEEKLKVFGA